MCTFVFGKCVRVEQASSQRDSRLQGDQVSGEKKNLLMRAAERKSCCWLVHVLSRRTGWKKFRINLRALMYTMARRGTKSRVAIDLWAIWMYVCFFFQRQVWEQVSLVNLGAEFSSPIFCAYAYFKSVQFNCYNLPSAATRGKISSICCASSEEKSNHEKVGKISSKGAKKSIACT